MPEAKNLLVNAYFGTMEELSGDTAVLFLRGYAGDDVRGSWPAAAFVACGISPGDSFLLCISEVQDDSKRLQYSINPIHCPWSRKAPHADTISPCESQQPAPAVPAQPPAAVEG